MDWVLGTVVACFAVVFVFAGRRSSQRYPRWAWWVAWACFLVAAGGIFNWQRTRAHVDGSQAFLETAVPRSGRPGGYVSSDRCLACHPDEYHSWHQSFHRTMTQLARS